MTTTNVCFENLRPKMILLIVYEHCEVDPGNISFRDKGCTFQDQFANLQ